ncbi:MAG: NAD(P)H-dependent oxidoreductase subunit E [Chloroflexi bacterium]|nr:NAD(P)H-dependent oxidoreductase subunit E [Chloroflexota bacterium]
MTIELAQVDTIIAKHGADQRALISLLLDIQDQFYYLPQDALQRVAEQVGVPPVQVYQVARFYKAFSLKPRGKHLLTVCLGTACHVRGGDRLVDQLSRLLHVSAGETTADKLFTLQAVNCLGCCALGPVMVVDGTYYGKMSATKIDKVLDKYRNGKEIADDD